MSIAVAFTTMDAASGHTTKGHVAIGPIGERVELAEGQVLAVGADLHSLGGRVFHIFGWGEQGWMLEECP